MTKKEIQIKKKIGARIIKELKKLNLSKTEAGKISGITRDQVRYICTGEKSYTVDSLIKLVYSLGIKDFKI